MWPITNPLTWNVTREPKNYSHHIAYQRTEKIGIYYIFLFNHSHWWFIGKDTTFVHLSQPHSSSVNSNYLLSMFASFTCLIHVHTYKARMPPKKYKKLFNDYPSKKVWHQRKAWHCFQEQRWEPNTPFFFCSSQLTWITGQFSWGPLKFLEGLENGC